MTDDDPRMLDELGRALPRVAPPTDLFARVQAEIAARPAASPGRRRPRLQRRLGAFALAAAAAAVALFFALSSNGPGTPTATAAVVSHLAGAGVHGKASLFKSGAPSGTLRLSLAAVPAPPAGHHYEVWVLARGETAMSAVGAFTPDTARVELRLPLPERATYAAVDISVQKNGGPAQHSNVSLAGGTFTPGQ